MKKNSIKFLLIACLLGLLSCSTNNNINSHLNYSSEESFLASEEMISSENISSNKGIGIKSHEFTSKEDTTSGMNNSSKDNSSYSSSKNSSASSNYSYSSKDYELLNTPPNKNNPLDITDWQNFSFVEYLPSDFSYIYGNNKATPDIYADGGGLVMDKNEGPRKGLQTPYFNTWNKIELRIQLGKFHGTSKSQNKNDPVFTIDCFNSSGSLIDTYFIEEINVSDNSEVKTYIRNSEVCYLEIRATNLPVKSNKVYNFGISGISLKGWIYD